MGAKKAVVITPADVRTWAEANGHKVAARGRLHSDIINAYNDNNKIKFDSAIKPDAGKMLALKGKRKTESGRTVPWQKSVSTVEIRNAAIAAGIPLGARGRMPADVIQAFADNTLTDLAANWNDRVTVKTQQRSNAFQVLASDALNDDEATIAADGPAVMLEQPSDGETTEISV